MAHSRLLMRRHAAFDTFVDRRLGVGGHFDPSDKPLKSEPTIVTKADITDYAGIVVPLVKSLNDDDLVKHIVYADPDVEHAEVERLLAEAEKLDGCEQGLTCKGWRDGEFEDIPLTEPNRIKAALLRREALTHRAEARLMEDRIAERGLKKTAYMAEVKLWQEWLDYRRRFEKFLTSVGTASIVKGSDFQEMQRFDLEYQWFRRQYEKMTGIAPTRHLTVTPPEPSSVLGPIVTIMALATVLTGLWYFGPVIAAGLGTMIRPTPKLASAAAK